MDPETLSMTQGVPPISLLLTWAGCYLLNLVLLIICTSTLSWIFNKTLGWVITHTTSILGASGITLFFWSTFLIPGRMLPLSNLLPGNFSLIPFFYWSGIILAGLALLNLFFRDIPHRLSNTTQKSSRKKTPPPKPWAKRK